MSRIHVYNVYRILWNVSKKKIDGWSRVINTGYSKYSKMLNSIWLGPKTYSASMWAMLTVHSFKFSVDLNFLSNTVGENWDTSDDQQDLQSTEIMESHLKNDWKQSAGPFPSTALLPTHYIIIFHKIKQYIPLCQILFCFAIFINSMKTEQEFIIGYQIFFILYCTQFLKVRCAVIVNKVTGLLFM